MKLAADQGHAGAQFNYGVYLRGGYGVVVNPVESARYIESPLVKWNVDVDRWR